MFKKIAIGLVVVIAAFLGYVALQSPDYVVSRDILVRAPAEQIFPYLNSPKLADEWAPWTEIDPAAKMTHSGPGEGVGARSDWTNGEQLGTGSATITESVANERVGIQLEYVEPMAMSQYSEYLIEPVSADEARVTWRVRGKNSLFGRVMCVFMDMDKVVGGLFEKGLTKLKTVVEKAGPAT